MLRSLKSDLGNFRLLLLPAAVLFLAVFIIPQLGILWSSFSDSPDGAEIYLQLFQSKGIQQIFWRTFTVALWSTVITMAMAYALAYVVVQSGPRQRDLLLLAILFSFCVSALIRALAWLILLTDRGILNTALIDIGIIEKPIRLAYSDTGVLIGMIHFLLPIATLALVAGFRNIDASLTRAARGLGASHGVAFIRVFLPLSFPSLFGTGVLTFVLALGFYIVPTLLGDGKTTVIAEYISIEVLDYANWVLPSAAAVVLVLATILLVMLAARLVGARRLGIS